MYGNLHFDNIKKNKQNHDTIVDFCVKIVKENKKKIHETSVFFS